MCTGSVQANSLKFDNIIFSDTYTIEGNENFSDSEDDYSEDELKALRNPGSAQVRGQEENQLS